MNFTLTQNVKVYEKDGGLKQLGELVKEAGYHKAFLVCGPSMVKLGVAKEVQTILADAGIKSVLYDKVQPDPPAEIVDEGAKLCNAEKCDCVIAVGGGSTIDTARGINILRFNKGGILDYADMSRHMAPSPGLIVVPTTSGTGSELSNGLIVSDTKKGVKVPILAVAGMSEYAILDASLTKDLPPSLTMATGLDVFSHACEAYMSRLACPLTDIICEKIMSEVIKYLPRAVNEGADQEARERMLAASSLAGWMLACASAHLGHSVAHVIGACYHIQHGLACAYSLPPTLRFLASSHADKIKKVGQLLGAAFTGSESPQEISDKAAQAYIDFCKGLGLAAIGIEMPDAGQLDKLAQSVAHEPLTFFSPVPVTEEAARSILRDLFS